MTRHISPYLPALRAAADRNGLIPETLAIATIAALAPDATLEQAKVRAVKKINEYRIGKKRRNGKRGRPMIEHAYSADGERFFSVTDHYTETMKRNDDRAAA